jgi:hypothetical protein
MSLSKAKAKQTSGLLILNERNYAFPRQSARSPQRGSQLP